MDPTFPSSLGEAKPAGLLSTKFGELGLDASTAATFSTIRVGVCTMDKKAKSKPMIAILTRLNLFADFDILTFGDDLILDKPIEQWPQVDCLVSFYSSGFPLEKAEKYAEMMKEKDPKFMCLNDLKLQHVLHDRRSVYRTLADELIPVTKYIQVTRTPRVVKPATEDSEEEVEWDDPEGFVETEDSITMNGMTITKPFVEKPIHGEDHNVWIYYPADTLNGGVKKLFRKKGNKSSEFYPEHPGTVRRNGSFLYERFMQTGGTDVKVYTVGPHYAHAEARKSPVVDGFVERFPDGKEIRYPVLLTLAEKEIARKVNLAFGQFVCGFDLLRSEGKSYVCDVNGWSFVKNSEKYYADAADIMRQHILHHLSPHKTASGRDIAVDTSNLLGLESPGASPAGASSGSRKLDRTGSISIPIMGSSKMSAPTVSAKSDDVHGSPNYFSVMDNGSLPSFMLKEGSYEDITKAAQSWHRTRHELRAIIAVIRHGDRTPKQKMKVKVTQKPLLDLMSKFGGGYFNGKLKQAKLKKPHELQDVLDTIRQTLNDLEETCSYKMYDLMSQVEGNSDDDEEREFLHKMRLAKHILERGGKFSGINRKVQMKPLEVKINEEKGHVEVVEALMIIKHGGVLTDCGKKQSIELGAKFRKQMYPQGKGGEGDGLLRLHSTYRHDLKIYSSDEGRVQVSAAAFTKGLLDLEGDSLVPIMASLVNKEQQILDAFGKGVDEALQEVKIKLQCAITGGLNKLILPKFASQPTNTTVTLSQSPMKGKKVVVDVGETPKVEGIPENSIEILQEMNSCIRTLCDHMLERLGHKEEIEDHEDFMMETQAMLDYERWKAHLLSFCKRGKYNISEISDIYDSCKHDLISEKFKDTDEDFLLIKKTYCLAKTMAAIVVPNEYGMTGQEKLNIGHRICSELLKKLHRDFSAMRQQSKLDVQEFLDQEEREREASEEDDEEGGGGGTHRLAAEFAEGVKTPLRHVRSRFYHTSESHIHALHNVLAMEGIFSAVKGVEFDYLSSIVFRVFENPEMEEKDDARWTVDILFSPGCVGEPSDGCASAVDLVKLSTVTLKDLESIINLKPS
ncbi:histidine phosphatase [Chloropicon primus]|uniref:Inositol hexakisphosphate and diphosphoinositol-pentakisphosphate kinase n=1 Tax=Chloropicon primus TaxID=1764295 RepID=A0A5B8MFY5_9CHLO|nr:histidine phosphatase [Chloropicon primus]UPQ97461.1 histidine phosphatase [Chloropicon primus]|eukprot:QDZ18250.1 histidine phosphatase [Chloropicon primus]